MAVRRMTSSEPSATRNPNTGMTDVPVSDIVDVSPRSTAPMTNMKDRASGDLVLKNYADYLKQHAMMTIWGNPYEDKQYILELSQLTGKGGVRTDVELFDRTIDLPSKNDYYHLYMIGGNFPYQFGLPDIEERWVSLVDWCNEFKYSVILYTIDGVMLPLHCCYLYKEYDDNLVLAIKEFTNVPVKLGVDDIYMHTRKANFFHYPLADKVEDKYKLAILSKALNRDVDVLDQTSLHGFARQKRICSQYFKNGKLVNSYLNLKNEDNVEVRADASIIGYQYHRVGDLRTYQSVLDKSNKYLIYLYDTYLMLPNPDKMQIHYRDDIEIYLIKLDKEYQSLADLSKPESVTRLDTAEVIDSLYYHRHQEDSLRMVTHQSYGIPVEYLHSVIQKHDSKKELNNWYLKVIVRDSGYKRRLGPDRNLVYRLEQLPYQDKVDAMVSTESTIENWKARVLEQSSYNFLMRAYQEEITADKVIDAYGYHLTSLVLANPNVAASKLKVGENQFRRYFTLPVGCADRSTIYEYDENGKLLGYYHHQDGFSYAPVHDETVFIEAIVGLGSNRPTLYHNPDSINVDSLVNYRFYRANVKPNGEFTTKHVDVTDELDVSDVPNGYPVHLDKRGGEHHWVVMGDDRFLAGKITVSPNKSGMYRFTLNFGPRREPLIVPYQKIHVWAEGVALVEGIDFIVDFPHVTITSFEFLNYVADKNAGEEITFTYRGLGHPDKQGVRHPPEETGFIYEGKISLDNDSTIHNNRVNRFIIGGGVYHPSAFGFDIRGDAMVAMPNGTPYSIDSHYIALRGFAGNRQVHEGYDVEKELEAKVDAYLGKNKPPRTDLPEITPLKRRYRLFSPFVSALISHLYENEEHYRDFDYRDKVKLDRAVRPILHLLNSDPAYVGHDSDFTVVYPTYNYQQVEQPKPMHHRLYAIAEHVIKQYLKHPVDLTDWYKVTRSRER